MYYVKKVVQLLPTLLFASLLIVFTSQVNAARLFSVNKDEAKSIRLSKDISSVFISNPAIADYSTIGKRTLVVYGKSVGRTSLIIFDGDNHTILERTIVVNTSLINVEQHVAIKYPDLDIEIYNLGDKVVLNGTVATESQKNGIERLVGELLGKSGTEEKLMAGEGGTQLIATKYSYKGIVNNLKVATTKQVSVKLTVAEVSQSFVENLGFQFYNNGSNGSFINSIVNFSASDIVSIINAVADNSIGQVLAEPNISVISGGTASFLVGGELPVVTSSDSGSSVSYREYGIKLNLTANVEQDDKIKLAIMPEVSSLDSQYRNATYDVPALKTRKASTTVELADGQSFVLAGLLNNEEVESLSKIPFIGDIPILGALFRYSKTERKKTELVIVATVSLVTPLDSKQMKLPDFQRTTNLERLFDVHPDKNEDDPTREWLVEGGFIQ